jgi:hypothetical protein
MSEQLHLSLAKPGVYGVKIIFIMALLAPKAVIPILSFNRTTLPPVQPTRRRFRPTYVSPISQCLTTPKGRARSVDCRIRFLSSRVHAYIPMYRSMRHEVTIYRDLEV